MEFTFTKHQYQRRLSKFNKMTVTIKYFGLIADITSRKEEVFSSDDAMLNAETLVSILSKKYADLSNSSFVVAVNKKIVIGNLELNNNDTIALLPPFAGG